MEISVSQENYLKAIYKLASREGVASNQAIASVLESTPASVTNMLRKLTEMGWIDYEAYRGATLTAAGNKRALELVRKHRLWEVFLVEKLQYDWDAVHPLAEELEHIGGRNWSIAWTHFWGIPNTIPTATPFPIAKETFGKDNTSWRRVS
jgi:DtxR family Mn-dependent transcriptional regulator